MDDSLATPSSPDGAEVSVEDEQRAIRRPIRHPGSSDFEDRAIARTYVLSAGDGAIPILIEELKADKQRSKTVAQRVAFLVAGIVLIGPIAGAYVDRPWIVPAVNITACIVLLLACILFKRPAWSNEAAKLLARYEGHEVTRAMIDSLTDVWGEEQPRLRAAIIQRLGSVTPDDAVWLEGETRERVVALLSMPNWSSATCVDEVLTIARALATVGAVEALPVLKGENCASLQGERRERLQIGLDQVIAELEQVAARQRTAGEMLRPAETNTEALVRSVDSAPAADSSSLARPVEDIDAAARP
jgi:hypothetical protein